jgi:hypothetical protein
MASPDLAQVLVVTDRVEAPPKLLDSIRGRTARGPLEFHVLVPNPALAEWHPIDAIKETLHDADYDEIIPFTAPHR